MQFPDAVFCLISILVKFPFKPNQYSQYLQGHLRRVVHTRYKSFVSEKEKSEVKQDQVLPSCVSSKQCPFRVTFTMIFPVPGCILLFTSLSETFYVPSAKELSNSFCVRDAYIEHSGDIMGITSTCMISGANGYHFNINVSKIH